MEESEKSIHSVEEIKQQEKSNKSIQSPSSFRKTQKKYTETPPRTYLHDMDRIGRGSERPIKMSGNLFITKPKEDKKSDDLKSNAYIDTELQIDKITANIQKLREELENNGLVDMSLGSNYDITEKHEIISENLLPENHSEINSPTNQRLLSSKMSGNIDTIEKSPLMNTHHLRNISAGEFLIQLNQKLVDNKQTMDFLLRENQKYREENIMLIKTLDEVQQGNPITKIIENCTDFEQHEYLSEVCNRNAIEIKALRRRNVELEGVAEFENEFNMCQNMESFNKLREKFLSYLYQVQKKRIDEYGSPMKSEGYSSIRRYDTVKKKTNTRNRCNSAEMIIDNFETVNCQLLRKSNEKKINLENKKMEKMEKDYQEKLHLMIIENQKLKELIENLNKEKEKVNNIDRKMLTCILNNNKIYNKLKANELKLNPFDLTDSINIIKSEQEISTLNQNDRLKSADEFAMLRKKNYLMLMSEKKLSKVELQLKEFQKNNEELTQLNQNLQSENDKISIENINYKESVNILQKRVNELSEKGPNSKLNEQIKTLKLDIEKLNKQLKEVKSEIDTNISKIKSLTNENNKKIEENKKLDENNKKYIEEIKKCNIMIEDSKKELIKLKKTDEELLNKKLDELNKKINELTSENTKKELLIKDISKKDEFKKKIDELTIELNKKDKELSHDKSFIETLEGTQLALKNHIMQLVEEEKIKSKTYEELLKESNNLIEENEKLKNNNLVNTGKINQLTINFENKINEIILKNQEIEKLILENSSLRNIIQQKENIIQENQKKILENAEIYHENQIKSEIEIKNYKNEILQNLSKLNDLNNTIHNLEKEKSDLLKKNDENSIKFNDSIRENENIHNEELKKLIEHLELEKEKNLRINEEINKIQKENNDLNEKINKNNDLLNTTNENTIINLENEINEKNNFIDKFKKEIELKNKEIDQLNKDKNDVIEILKQKIKEKENTHNEEIKKLNEHLSLEKEKNIRINDEINKIQKENNDLNEKINKKNDLLNITNENTIINLENEINEKNNFIDKFKKEIELKNKEIEQLNKNKNDVIEILNDKIKEKENNHNEDLKKLIEHLELEKEKNLRINEEINKIQKENNNLNEKINKKNDLLNTTKENTIINLENEINEKNNFIDNFKKEIELKNKEIDQLNKDKNDLIEILKEKIKQKEDEILNLNEKQKKLHEENEEKINKNKLLNEELTLSIEKKYNSELNEIKQINEKLKEQIENKQKELTFSENQLTVESETLIENNKKLKSEITKLKTEKHNYYIEKEQELKNLKENLETLKSDLLQKQMTISDLKEEIIIKTNIIDQNEKEKQETNLKLDLVSAELSKKHDEVYEEISVQSFQDFKKIAEEKQELESEILKLKEQIKQLEITNKENNDIKLNYSFEKSKYKEKYLEMKKKNIDLEKDLNLFNEKYEKVFLETNKQLEIRENQKKTLENLKEILNKKENEIFILQEKINHQNLEILDLKHDSTSLKRELLQKNDELIKKLKNDTRMEIEEEHVLNLSNNESFSSRKEKVKRGKNPNNNESDEKTVEITNLRTLLIESAKEKELLEIQCEEKLKETDNLSQQNKILLINQNFSENQIHQLQTEISTLKNDLNKKEKLINLKLEENKLLNQQYNDLSIEYKSEITQKQDQINKYTKIIQEKESEILQMQQKIKNSMNSEHIFEEQLEKSFKDIEKKENQIKILTKNLETAQQKVFVLKTLLVEESKEKEKIEDQCSIKLKDIDLIEIKKINAEKNLEIINKKLLETESELKKVKNSNENLEQIASNRQIITKEILNDQCQALNVISEFIMEEFLNKFEEKINKRLENNEISLWKITDIIQKRKSIKNNNNNYNNYDNFSNEKNIYQYSKEFIIIFMNILAFLKKLLIGMKEWIQKLDNIENCTDLRNNYQYLFMFLQETTNKLLSNQNNKNINYDNKYFEDNLMFFLDFSNKLNSYKENIIDFQRKTIEKYDKISNFILSKEVGIIIKADTEEKKRIYEAFYRLQTKNDSLLQENSILRNKLLKE